MRTQGCGSTWIVAAIFALTALSAAETPADPAAALAELAKAGSPDTAKLKEAYLKLQWERLIGNVPQKRAAKADKEERAIQGPTGAPLNEQEKTALKTWLERDTKFREKLLLALSPGGDDYANAARLALKLNEKFSKDFAAFENLALAFITVWDDPLVLQVMHGYGVPELYPYEEKCKLCPVEDAFGWFTRNQARLCPWFKATPWRLLTYVASDVMEASEREWIFKKYPAFRSNFGTVYSEIEYDFAKLQDKHGKLGSKEYTLENLKQCGGVCRDQAYYARAVCSAYGLPAYFATGTANSAGRHAWVGWIVQEGGAYKLASHGRYEYDKYFTAQIFDPRSGQQIFDYLVGIEAKALSDEKGYDAADLFFRTWEECPGLPAKNRAELLISALRKNAFHLQAWLALGEATAAGDLPRASAEAQWEYLSKNFRDFPDFTFSMLSTFSKIFKTPAERYTFYETTAKMFQGLKRQDLVASLRIQEIDMCVAENRKDLAAQVAVSGTQECAGEGAQGAALAKRAVELLTEMNQPQMAVKPLQMALSKMTKVRAKEVNPHWIAVTEALRDVYKSLGDTKNAAAQQAELDRAGKNLK